MKEQNRKTVSRRRFCKLAAGLAVAPWFVPAHAMGANDRITVGCIGLGNQGGGLLSHMLRLDDQLQVVALCDVKEGMLRRALRDVEGRYGVRNPSGRYTGCQTYRDFRDLLARPDIDAVVIAVPDHWHAILADRAAQAGKDIYLEKPLSLTIGEAYRMVEAVRRYGRVLQVGSMQRSMREFRRACELVRNGYLGEIQTVHVNIGFPSGQSYLPSVEVPDDIDYEMWLGPAPWAPYHPDRVAGNYSPPAGWRWIRDYSGGQMTDWGAHHFDIAQWGLGMDGTQPVRIFPPDGKDFESLTFDYANGVRMYHREAGGVQPKGVRFTGTEGWLDVSRGSLTTHPKSLQDQPLTANDRRLYDSGSHSMDWIECIRTRRRPICDVEIGASSVIVCHLGVIAYDLGRPLVWNPEGRRFEGDAEANRLLDRASREPWAI